MPALDYDDVIRDHVGQCGVFQVAVLALFSLSSMLGGEYISHNFIAGYQQHWCRVPELEEVPYEQQRLIAIPTDSEGTYSSCEAFNLSYSDYTLTDFYYWNRSARVTDDVIACTDWVYDQSQYVTTISSEWNLVCEDQWKNSFISTITMLGALIGSFLSGYASDAIGRKPALIIFMTSRLIGDVLTPLAPSYWVILLSRFVVGLSSLATWIISYTYLMETTGATYRPVFGMTASLFFSVGFTVISMFAYFIRSFRLLGLAITVPSAFFLLAFILIPESARWLITSNKVKKADRVFHKMAAINGKTFPDNFAYKQLISSERTEGESSSSSIQAWGRYLANGRLLFQLIIICLMWFTVSLVYNSLTFNVGTLAGNIYVNTMLLGLVEIPGLLLSLLTARWARLGRRGTAGWFLAIAGLANLLTVPFILCEIGPATTAISLVGKCFIAGAFSNAHIFTTELFPTEIRNGGLGVSSVVNSLGGMLAPYATYLINIWLPLPTMLFGIFGLVVGLMVLVFLPETLGAKMTETVDELIILRSPDSYDLSQAAAANASCRSDIVY